MEHQNSKFCQENSKTGDINHEMKAHGSNMGIDMANDGVIARLFYCHHAELSVQMHGRIEWQNAEGASVSEGCSFNIAGTSPGSGILHQEVQEGPAEAVFDKEVFREETQDPEAESRQDEGAKHRDTEDLTVTEGQQDHGSCQGC